MPKLPRDTRTLADYRDGRRFRSTTINHKRKPAPTADEYEGDEEE